MAEITKSRQQILRESRAPKEPVDDKSLVLQTGLGGAARPIPLRDQIMAMVRNELRDTREDKGQIGPLDWQLDEDEPDPMSIYELAVDIHENPTDYDHLFPAEPSADGEPASEEAIRAVAEANRASRSKPKPTHPPTSGGIAHP